MRLAEPRARCWREGELYRAAGRRRLEQFSNVQNAVEAFEKLREARARRSRGRRRSSKELYGKRRAYRQLYELYEFGVESLTGAASGALWADMAKMAPDRLDRGADATRLYKRIIEEDPENFAALDAPREAGRAREGFSHRRRGPRAPRQARRGPDGAAHAAPEARERLLGPRAGYEGRRSACGGRVLEPRRDTRRPSASSARATPTMADYRRAHRALRVGRTTGRASPRCFRPRPTVWRETQQR